MNSNGQKDLAFFSALECQIPKNFAGKKCIKSWLNWHEILLRQIFWNFYYGNNVLVLSSYLSFCMIWVLVLTKKDFAAQLTLNVVIYSVFFVIDCFTDKVVMFISTIVSRGQLAQWKTVRFQIQRSEVESRKGIFLSRLWQKNIFDIDLFVKNFREQKNGSYILLLSQRDR